MTYGNIHKGRPMFGQVGISSKIGQNGARLVGMNVQMERPICQQPCRNQYKLWKIIVSKGQIISKANCQAANSSKKQTNEFVFTTMQRVFVRFFEGNRRSQKTFSKLTDL